MKIIKYNLKDTTFIIPVRIDSKERLQNFFSVVKFLELNFTTNIIALEADTNEKITKIKGITKIFVEDNNLIFHRTKYLNQMTLQSATPFLAIWDADVIIPPEQIIEAVNVLRENEADMMSPFDGRCLNTISEINPGFYKNVDVDFLKKSESKMKMVWDQSVGGAVIVNRDKYIESGMENENFYGWGLEDFERVTRWEILGNRSFRVDGPLYHLWHPKGINSIYSSVENRKRLEKEFQKVSEMSRQELKVYIKNSFSDLNREENIKLLNFDSILIITYGRSGSTLLQGILNSIDGCLIRGENNNLCYHIFEAYQALIKTKKYNGYTPNLPHFGSYLLNEKLFLKYAKDLFIEQLIGDQILNNDIVCYGFKEIRYVRIDEYFEEYLDFLQQVFPNVAFVFNTRNHREVVKSDWWAEKDPDEVTELLKRFESNALKYMDGKSNCFHIRYEDVVNKSEKLKGLFLFLGAEYNDEKVDFVLSSPHSYNPQQEKVKELFKKSRKRE